jgi:DNA-binding transcriptional LysR family regulator
MKSEFSDWSDVRIFLAVVRAGSTLAASRGLGMAQPTVARRIDALEHALSLILFERDTRGFQPTSEARELVEAAEALERAATALSEKARLVAGKSRAIRITSFSGAFSGRMPSVLEDFSSLHPEVRFEFISSDDYLDLTAGAADVAIRVAEKVDDPSVICRKIRVIGMSLFASKAYAARHPLPRSEFDLGEHKFIVYQGRFADRASEKWLRERIDPGQVAMAVADYRAAEGAVLMGAGIGIFPSRIDGDYDTFVRCFDLPTEMALFSWLLVNPVAWRRPEVKAFAAFFVPRYRELFAGD